MMTFRPALLASAAALALSIALPAQAGGLGEMTDAERQAFREEIRAYLLENPEVLMEAINELQARQETQAAARDEEVLQTRHAAIFEDAASWVGGNLQGDITIVEFVDYRCGYCRKAHDEVAELVASDGNIRFVLKEYPILGDDSVISSKFAIATLQLHGPEVYKTMHDALITLRGAPTPETLALLAKDMGLDPAPILARMEAPEVMAVIEANHALANEMDISGTPTFVVDGTLVRGYLPLDNMRAIVKEQREG